MKQFYHYCADGQDSRNFIISRKDYIAAMNIIALCAANTEAAVVAFSLEDSHPHKLIFGTIEECAAFKEMFETLFRHYAVRSRLGKGEYYLRGELYPIGEDLSYLKNVAVYTIIQPTKDGKRVMPYDYLWKVCNGIILPTNYVDVSRFESIYGTHNTFRVFLSNNRQKEEEILRRMAGDRGVSLEDGEVRQLCGDECKQLFGIRDPRRLSPEERIVLAQNLRRKHRISFRQLAFAVRLPEKELRRYVK